jgi:RimJ/RimL family protein N-acetyltransferase
MFGPIMRVRTRTSLLIEMAPFQREILGDALGGMQSYEVIKCLGRVAGTVIENQIDYYERTRLGNDDMLWGIYACDRDNKTFIGSTGLHDINDFECGRYKSATTGIVIWDKGYWGQGVASVCHAARTMYAFDIRGCIILKSKVIRTNTGSLNAVKRVGYVVKYERITDGLERGMPRYECNLECVTPEQFGNAYRWMGSDEQYEPKWVEGRENAQKTVEWARENVTF